MAEKIDYKAYLSQFGKIETDAKDRIKDLTAEIRELRHELKVCGDIQQRSGHVRENLAAIDRDRLRERVR